MSKAFYYGPIGIVHTDNISEDVSLQKSTWDLNRREQNSLNLKHICADNGINAEGNLAIVGFSQDNNSFRRIYAPDKDILVNKKDGNVIITDSSVALMGWAADCLLIAFMTEDQQVVAIAHASVISLNSGVLDSVVDAFKSYGYDPFDITAYMGTCIGVDSYEYDYERAVQDFSNFKDFIIMKGESEKVYLDLYEAAKARLKELGFSEIIDLFSEHERDTYSAKDDEGNFRFPSYRRDVEVKDGKVVHINGQYGLIIQKAVLAG